MVRPGYKRTEVGEIPMDWEVRRVRSFCRPVRGSSPRPAGDPRYFDGTFIPWLTVAALTTIPSSQIMVTATDDCLTEEGAALSRKLTAGTVIIANSGATLGVAKILGIECCANDGVAALLHLHDLISPHYLVYVINSLTDHLRTVVATGNGQPNLNTRLIGDLALALPPTRREQDKIASTFRTLDEQVESLEHLLAKKRAIKQGAMQSLLTGAKRLPGFTEAWTTRTFTDLFYFSGGHSASRDQLSATGHFYLHYGDIHTTTQTTVDVAADRDKLPRLDIPLTDVSPSALLDDGDIVFVDASEDVDGTSKHVVVVNATHEPLISGLHTIVAKPRGTDLDPIYRRFCFQSPGVKLQFRFYAVGTKVLGVSKGNIGKIQISLPPILEQAAIAEVLADLDADIDATEAKLDKARALKHGMMQELLTGRIRLV